MREGKKEKPARDSASDRLQPCRKVQMGRLGREKTFYFVESLMERREEHVLMFWVFLVWGGGWFCFGFGGGAGGGGGGGFYFGAISANPADQKGGRAGADLGTKGDCFLLMGGGKRDWEEHGTGREALGG